MDIEYINRYHKKRSDLASIDPSPVSKRAPYSLKSEPITSASIPTMSTIKSALSLEGQPKPVTYLSKLHHNYPLHSRYDCPQDNRHEEWSSQHLDEQDQTCQESSSIYALVLVVIEEFHAEGGPMDQIANRWLQSALRTSTRHYMDVYEQGWMLSMYSIDSFHRYHDHDFETVGDFFQESTGSEIAFDANGYGTVVETWQDRCIALYERSLIAWLKQKNPNLTTVSLSDEFWSVMSAIEGSEHAWLERYSELPFKSLFVRLVQAS